MNEDGSMPLAGNLPKEADDHVELATEQLIDIFGTLKDLRMIVMKENNLLR